MLELEAVQSKMFSEVFNSYNSVMRSERIASIFKLERSYNVEQHMLTNIYMCYCNANIIVREKPSSCYFSS